MATQDRDPEGERRRLDELDARLKKARGPEVKPSQDMRVSHRETGVAYRVLVDMIAGLLVGGFFGYWLDRWMGWAPWSLIGGLIVQIGDDVYDASVRSRLQQLRNRLIEGRTHEIQSRRDQFSYSA